MWVVKCWSDFGQIRVMMSSKTKHHSPRAPWKAQSPLTAFSDSEPVTLPYQMLIDDPKTHSCQMAANYQLPCLGFPDYFTSLKLSHLARVIEWGAAKPMKAPCHPDCHRPAQPESQPCPNPNPSPAQPCPAPGQAWPQPHLIKLPTVFGEGPKECSCQGFLVRTCHSLGLSWPPMLRLVSWGCKGTINCNSCGLICP